MSEEDYTIPFEVVKEVYNINHGLDVSELRRLFPTVNRETLRNWKSKIIKDNKKVKK